MKAIKFLYYPISAFMYLFYALWNRFPIVYSDTGTYIGSGFMPYSPHDRPFTYGIFLRIASLNGWSLWTVIVTQALLLSWLILEWQKQFFSQTGSRPADDIHLYNKALLLNLFCVIFTGVSFPCSQLMADIFTPIAVLSLSLILFGSNSIFQQVFLFALYFGSVATHNSHLLMFLIFIPLLALCIKFFFKQVQISARTYVLALICTSLAVMPMSKSMRESGHVFFMGALCEHGILKTWLDENCQEHGYFICASKDSLPRYAWEFVWKKDSPLSRQGWDESRDDYRAIIASTVTSPRYLALHMRESIKATKDQLLRFDIGDGTGVFNEETNLGQLVKTYLPEQLPAYLNSRQNRGDFGFIEPMNQFYDIAMAIMLLVVPFIWFHQRKKLTSLQHLLVIVLLLSICLNAWSCGTFANAIPRLGLKMMWLVSLALGLMLTNLYNPKSLQEAQA